MLKAEDIRQAATGLGFQTLGVCPADPPTTLATLDHWLGAGFHGEMAYMQRQREARASLDSVLPGAVSVIVVSLNYYQSVEHRPGQPRIARYALGRDYHKLLRRKLTTLAKRLGEAHPQNSFRACVDSAPILEREYANRAGIGWFGKNTLLIDSKRGSWFFIGSLLTDLPIEPDKPAQGGCGSCSACIDACPTGAIVHTGGTWQVDARQCLSYLTIEKRGGFTAQESAKIGDWTFGCDVCQEVCPFNHPRQNNPLRSLPTTEPGFLPRDWPGLDQLAQITHDEWDTLTRGSPIRRAGHAGIVRNARANLKNQPSK